MTRWLVLAAVVLGSVACGDTPESSSVTPSRLSLSETPQPAHSTPPPSDPPTATPSETVAPTSTPTTVLGAMATDETYGVAFVLPQGWTRPDEATARWQGEDGAVQVDAVKSTALRTEDACVDLAEHGLQPYGSDPTIESVEIDGQNACLVLPSDDQAPELEDQAAIVARYPQPRAIDGETYEFVALYVDEPHVRQIASTLRFIG